MGGQGPGAVVVIDQGGVTTCIANAGHSHPIAIGISGLQRLENLVLAEGKAVVFAAT